MALENDRFSLENPHYGRRTGKRIINESPERMSSGLEPMEAFFPKMEEEKQASPKKVKGFRKVRFNRAHKLKDRLIAKNLASPKKKSRKMEEDNQEKPPFTDCKSLQIDENFHLNLTRSISPIRNFSVDLDVQEGIQIGDDSDVSQSDIDLYFQIGEVEGGNLDLRDNIGVDGDLDIFEGGDTFNLVEESIGNIGQSEAPSIKQKLSMEVKQHKKEIKSQAKKTQIKKRIVKKIVGPKSKNKKSKLTTKIRGKRLRGSEVLQRKITNDLNKACIYDPDDDSIIESAFELKKELMKEYSMVKKRAGRGNTSSSGKKNKRRLRGNISKDRNRAQIDSKKMKKS